MALSVIRSALFGALVLTVAAGAARPAPLMPPVAPAPRGLAVLEPGDWALKDRETGKEMHLCLGDTRQLLQLRHPKISCSRFVVSDSAQNVVVTNDCAAAGNERTDIRIETPRLIQLQSQGIANGAPFAMMIEGRHTGACR